MTKLSYKYFIIILFLIVTVVLAGFFYWQIKRKIKEGEEAPPASLPVFKPEAKTAQKYFPYGGNAIDFREDGWLGDFEIQISKKEKTAEISWPKEIKVSRVQVFNLGKLWDLQDHRVVFDIGNEEIKNLLSPPQIQPGEQLPAPISPVYLESPYEVGKIPEGFFNLTFYDQKFTAKSPIFIKDARYSIEISGRDENNQSVFGIYTLDF